ncbi:hypothetical protein QVZ41_13995 [Wenyingzhuangia sp. chi5]|uniref:Uncharacterized protein n=1 Tax=Wenyingzhuangia gilva TaxID=3057677 RepID=A0ABT8VVE7_9FLAO|nr:hypothetical protein [Wenyingzhuangia sp. chi5]MDO3695959.1 hypothetical protein [Wenyingzhuangia sp. chi5]
MENSDIKRVKICDIKELTINTDSFSKKGQNISIREDAFVDFKFITGNGDKISCKFPVDLLFYYLFVKRHSNIDCISSTMS